MPPGFLQVAIPVLYVYDPDAIPTEPPGFDMGLLPVVSRALKSRAGTEQVTVITGTPTTPDVLPEAYTRLALQYPELTRASADASNLLAAEFVADHFDPEAVLSHLQRLVEERRKAAEVRVVEAEATSDLEDDELPEDDEDGDGPGGKGPQA